MVPVYLRETPGRIRALRAAFDARDSAALASLCHSLKGAGRVLGATALAAACEDMEHAAYAGGMPDRATLDNLIGLVNDAGDKFRRQFNSAKT